MALNNYSTVSLLEDHRKNEHPSYFTIVRFVNNFFCILTYTDGELKKEIKAKNQTNWSNKFLVLFDQQPKTRRHSLYNDIKHKKASSPHIGGVGPRKYFIFLLEK